MKESGVYEIVNTITGDCYIGSSIDLERRRKQHLRESTWKRNPNKQLYKDMKQYGKGNFLFKPVWLCNPEELKKYEQIAIEKYNPQYNICAAYTGLSKEEYQKKYNKQYRKENADSIKQYHKQYYKENADNIKQYRKENADNIKQYHKQYYKENADNIKQQHKQYNNQQCLYKNEMLSLDALAHRFAKNKIEHPTLEAKKYLIGE